MQGRALHEAEAVAAARWEATMSRSERRRRQQEAQLQQFEAAAARRWAATEPAVERDGDLQAELAASAWWAASGRPPTYRLYDKLGQPINCHLCGHDDAWTPEGDSELQMVRVFLCVHEPVQIGRGKVRQVSMVALHQVARCEASTPE